MKHLDEYRDADTARRLAASIKREAATGRRYRLMEFCGGHTHAIFRYGIEDLLPRNIEMVHGPGCPVCVTPLEIVDKACAIAANPEVTFTSYGDMLRVPGSHSDLLSLKARGADVRVVYSPMEAVRIARADPSRQVVFFAVGFETTAPANAMAVIRARELGLANFSILVSHVLVPPAMTSILDDEECGIDGFLAAGHVCAVMGWREYEPIAARYGVPIVVTGFEPLDLLEGILMAVRQLESGRAEVENQYIRTVRRNGNEHAQDAIRMVFQVADRTWREFGYLNVVLLLAPLGLAWAVLAVTFSVSVAITVVGLFVAGWLVVGARVLGGVYRGLARGLLGTDVIAPLPRRRGSGFWGQIRASLGDAAGWRAPVRPRPRPAPPRPRANAPAARRGYCRPGR